MNFISVKIHELVNKADNPGYAAAIKQMRQHYDKHLAGGLEKR